MNECVKIPINLVFNKGPRKNQVCCTNICANKTECAMSSLTKMHFSNELSIFIQILLNHWQKIWNGNWLFLNNSRNQIGLNQCMSKIWFHTSQTAKFQIVQISKNFYWLLESCSHSHSNSQTLNNYFQTIHPQFSKSKTGLKKWHFWATTNARLCGKTNGPLLQPTNKSFLAFLKMPMFGTKRGHNWDFSNFIFGQIEIPSDQIGLVFLNFELCAKTLIITQVI